MKVGKYYRNREDHCISGGTGCGVVYLSGCDMHCAYCLVYDISQEGKGVPYTPRQLAELLCSLQQRGVSHISLANVEPSADEVIEAVAIARELGLTVPLLNNFNGYAPTAFTRRLQPFFQGYIMDFKYADAALGAHLSAAPDYPRRALANLALLSAHYGNNRYDAAGLLQSGVLLRHLILPEQELDSMNVIDLISDSFPAGSILFSLMSQYTPMPGLERFPELQPCRMQQQPGR